MHFEARLIAIKPLLAGARVGYKGAYVSDSDTQLGIISAGYGDGYSRHFRTGTPVLINGRRVSLIGNVSMDLIGVDLGADASDTVGDIATLWGDGLPVEEVAPWAGAIPYELVCGVMNREDSEIVAGLAKVEAHLDAGELHDVIVGKLPGLRTDRLAIDQREVAFLA